MAMGLTPRQHEVLAYLRRHIADKGHAPTVRELASGLGISSVNSAYNALLTLEKRGAIRRLHGRSRAIEIIETDQRLGALCSYTTAELLSELDRRGVS